MSMKTSTYQLFVYGSLRSGFRNPMYNYLTQYFHLAGDAIVKGQFYDTGVYPVAIPSTDEHFISGELYEANNIDEFGWVIAQLDDYEGLNVESGERPLYKRELADVLQNGHVSKAWVYWYNQSIADFPIVETGDVFKYLQDKNTP